MIRNRRGRALVIAAALVGLSGVAWSGSSGQTTAGTLPRQIGDRAFWQMIVDFSEPDGPFRSDNFVSNEVTSQDVIPALRNRPAGRGVYLGVGPDQNFTYITALGPRLAFIVDIRRQNLIEHLLYKALVEMSDTRASFLSRLFSRPQPAGLARTAPPDVLLDAYRGVAPSQALFERNLKQVEDRLVTRHGFPLSGDDRTSLEYVYRAFFVDGPDLRYSSPRQAVGADWFPSYARLMAATDLDGQNHGYLATEQSFRTLREFEQRNLLVPIVGDFAGPKAIRAVAAYLKAHGATVDYFYTSNVEQYLFQGDAWARYCDNVAALPQDERSTFIRAYFDRGFRYPPGIVTPDLHSVPLLDPIVSFLTAVRAGQVRTYADLVGRTP
jgi:hypothetical protein